MENQPQAREVVIDLDQVWEPALVGILRASLFAGLGANAARDPSLTNFDLPGLMKFSYSRLVPDLQEIKLEFERWTLANAFREAVESFALALDRSYEGLLLAEWVKTGKRPTLSRFRKFFALNSESRRMSHPISCLSTRLGTALLIGWELWGQWI